MRSQPAISVRYGTVDDREWLRQWMVEQWGSEIVVVHGTTYYPHLLPSIIAELEGEPIGVLTYQIEERACEIVTLDTVVTNKGVGTALLEAVRPMALAAGCQRMWLITTNDNLDGLRFYQRRGFQIAGVAPGAVVASRQIKPEIPVVGAYGIPIRDEIELELTMGD